MPRQQAARTELHPKRAETLAWDRRPHMQMSLASEVSGVSPATLYSLAAEGKLQLFKLAGRTLVDTESLKALIASRQVWTPETNRGAAARAKRSEGARAALR